MGSQGSFRPVPDSKRITMKVCKRQQMVLQRKLIVPLNLVLVWGKKGMYPEDRRPCI